MSEDPKPEAEPKAEAPAPQPISGIQVVCNEQAGLVHLAFKVGEQTTTLNFHPDAAMGLAKALADSSARVQAAQAKKIVLANDADLRRMNLPKIGNGRGV